MSANTENINEKSSGGAYVLIFCLLPHGFGFPAISWAELLKYCVFYDAEENIGDLKLVDFLFSM